MHNIYWKLTFLKQTDYIIIHPDYILRLPFYRGFFENKKGSETSYKATFFVEFFDKIFFYNIA